MKETEKVKLVIEMRDRAYAQRLAQRLCELCSGLEIEICRKGEFCEWNDTADGYHLYGGCDILLSDSERAYYGLPEHTAFLKLRRQEIFLTAPRILELIAMAYEKKTGRGFLLKSESDAQILSFCAEQGGAGVTAICVTTARLLAGMQEGAVLYLQLLPPDAAWEAACLDWKLYTKISQPPLRPYAELEYRLRRGETCRLQPYLARDSYALHYLSLHRERKLLEALLACSGDFSWILADCGSGAPMPASKKHFCVRNTLDLRCGMTREMTSGEENLPALSAPEKIDIQNRGEAYCRSENAFTLSESPESFEAAREAVMADGCIEISMQGRFARDLRRMSQQLNFFTP